MVKRQMPERATLPNGRTFVARYEHITCNHFPANICLEQPYRQRAAPCGRRRVDIDKCGRRSKVEVLAAMF